MFYYSTTSESLFLPVALALNHIYIRIEYFRKILNKNNRTKIGEVINMKKSNIECN